MRWLLALALIAPFPAEAAAGVRIKDIGSFDWEYELQLSGTGIVTGLNRTGDSRMNTATVRALVARLQAQDVSLEEDDLIGRNAALVSVTATVRAGQRSGSRVDVTVSSLGDARSLEGGVLQTALLRSVMTGEVMATAQGELAVGGFSVARGQDVNQKNYPTVGRVPRGGMMTVGFDPFDGSEGVETVGLVLSEPDWTTAARIEEAIDAALEADVAHAESSGLVTLSVPESMRTSFPTFAAIIEAVEVQMDVPARVVVNPRTGTVVMGADVRIAPVAVAQGGLTIEVRRFTEVSQPNALSQGQTAAATNTTIMEVNEEEGKLALVEGADIGTLVGGLNAMGVKPRELIEILQAIRQAGALHAELVVL